MEKLSRKARYQDLRENLEQVSTEKISRDLSSQPASTFLDESLSAGDTKRGTAILDEVIGEVNRYNLSQRREKQAGNEDQDLRRIRDQYLEPLDTEIQSHASRMPSSRQSSTPSSRSSLSSSSTDRYDPMEIIADEVIEEDNLQTFDFSAGDFDKTIQEPVRPAKSKKASKRKIRKERKERKDQELFGEIEDEREEKTFSWVNVFLTIVILILIASICFTGYLIYKSGLV